MSGRTFAVVLMIGVISGLAWGEDDRTLQMKLPNGLTVLMRPVAGATQVTVVTLMGIGNDHDPAGKSGLAHLVEHLYVCSAAGTTPARTADAFMQAYSLGWNAQTGDDYTVFATVCRPDGLAGELTDAAARLRELQVTEAELQREKARLLAELESMYGGTTPLASRNLARQHVRPGPDSTRRGGVVEQVKAITLEDVTDRLRRYYKPCNAVIVLAGDFKVAQATALVESLLTRLPAGEAAPVPAALRAPKVGQRVTSTAEPTRAGAKTSVCVAVPAPGPSDPAYPAFLVLVTRLILAAGQNSSGAQVAFAPIDDPAFLSISAEAANPQEAAEAADRLDGLLNSVCGKPLEPSDVEGAVNGLGVMLGLTEMPDAAWAMNTYALAYSVGRRHQMHIEPARLRQAVQNLTPEQFHAQAQELLGAWNRVAVTVQPASPLSKQSPPL